MTWIIHRVLVGRPEYRCIDCGTRTCCGGLGLYRCTVSQTGPYAHRWQKIGSGKQIFRHVAPTQPGGTP